ncbi:MAG: hypothetical protein PHV33_07455 [Elusimicrobiales bacterium]|nr:hypothetical protein [Elusimicrobiales bacterium]
MKPYVIALSALFSLSAAAHSETLTLETYYPSPVGVYSNLTVTSTTVLAKNGGGVNVGTASQPSDLRVTGVANVNGALNVAGPVNIYNAIKATGVMVPGNRADDPTDAASKVDGAIYYNTTQKSHRVYKNGNWGPLSGGISVGSLHGWCEQTSYAMTCNNPIAPAKCVNGTYTHGSFTSQECACEDGYLLVMTGTLTIPPEDPDYGHEEVVFYKQCIKK